MHKLKSSGQFWRLSDFKQEKLYYFVSLFFYIFICNDSKKKIVCEFEYDIDILSIQHVLIIHISIIYNFLDFQIIYRYIFKFSYWKRPGIVRGFRLSYLHTWLQLWIAIWSFVISVNFWQLISSRNWIIGISTANVFSTSIIFCFRMIYLLCLFRNCNSCVIYFALMLWRNLHQYSGGSRGAYQSIW